MPNERDRELSGVQTLGDCPICAGPVCVPQGETSARCLCCNEIFPLDTDDEDAAA